MMTQVENTAQMVSAYETSKTKKKENYGKTIGKPELSEKAQKYYEDLKKKYSNLDFILVSNDMKEMAKAQAGSYANPNKMVVLIDEEKIERMANDEEYRKQYESIISNAATKLPQLKKSLGNVAGVKGFGAQVKDNGITSFFAVIDKSLAAQKKRIEKNAEKKAEKKKADAKKEAKKAEEEKRAEKYADKANEVTVTASSVEELVQKVNAILYGDEDDSIQTDSEKMIGQNFDFYQ